MHSCSLEHTIGLKSSKDTNDVSAYVPQGPSGNISWVLCLDLMEHKGTMTPKFETLVLGCVCFT